MGGPSGPGDSSVIAAFHHALATQGAVIVAIVAVLFVGWNQLRSMQYRRAVARGEQFPAASGNVAPEPSARRFLRITFGLLWLLDGLLQLQPGMPGGLPTEVIKPAAATSPEWVRQLVDSGITVWANHPSVAAASTVWIQVGIGLMLLVAPRGQWSQGAGLISAGWGLVVWSFGSAFGGIFAPGLTLLFGAPGAVLFYVVAGVLVALSDSAWSGPRLGRWVLGATGGLLLGFAVLQAWPGRGFWQGSIGSGSGSLVAMVSQMSQISQPKALSSLVSSFASFDRSHGWGVNLFAVVAMASIGTVLLVSAGSSRPSLRARKMLRPTMVVLAVLCVADWVLIEDFGFWGGTGTDPNSMLPLLAVAVCGFLALTRPAPATQGDTPEMQGAAKGMAESAEEEVSEGSPVLAGVSASTDALGPAASGGRSWWESVDTRYAGRVAAALGALGILLVGVAPMAAAAVSRTADPRIAEAVDGPPNVVSGSAPGFRLVDVHGMPVTLADLRGYTVVLTFLDPVCTTDCPIIAQELRVTNDLLGPAASKVRFVAIVANPVYRSTQNVAAFDRQEGLDTQANWRFLTGSLADLQSVWNAYGVGVQTPPAGGMVAHADIVYVIDAHGTLRRILNADIGSSTASLRSSFSGLLASQVIEVQKG